MKKVLSVVLCVVMLLALVAGCSKSATETTAASTTAAETTATTAATTTEAKEVTITYQTPSETDMFCTLFAEYQKTHPNVKLDVEVSPNDGYNVKMLAAAQSGTVADVSWWNGTQIVSAWDTGAFLDLSQYMNGQFNGRFIDGTFLLSQTNSGVYTCFPCEMQIQGFLENTALFAKYNLKVPTTFDDAMNCAKVLRENGLTLFGNGTGDTWPTWGWYYWFELYGFDEEKTSIYGTHEVKFADSSSRQALDRLIELHDAGAFPDNNATITYDMTCTNFISEKCAMMTTSTDWLTSIVGTDLDKAGSIQYSFGFNFPDSKYSQKVCVKMDGNGYCISSKIDQDKLAALIDFFDWFYSDEGANIAIQNGLTLPINFKLTADVTPLVKSIMDLTMDDSWTGMITTNYKASECWNRNHDVNVQPSSDLSTMVNGCVDGSINSSNIEDYIAQYDTDIDTAIADFAKISAQG